MQFMGGKYLNDCTVYTTLEPCVMCAGAIHHAGINNIVYGAKDPSSGFVSKTNNLFSKARIKRQFSCLVQISQYLRLRI